MTTPEIVGDKSVDLGFCEEGEPHLLTNRYFPSKVGGKPAWLCLENLPKAADLKCTKCGEPRIFLCQLYAPIEDKDDSFHRTIFVFICRNEECFAPNSAENIVVFRNQLPRFNDYYSSEPPAEFDKMPRMQKSLEKPEIPPLEKICSVCGCRGPSICSQCKNISYCGPFHQKKDWKYHKRVCKGESNATISESASKDLLYKEFEIIIEPEDSDEAATSTPKPIETEEDAEDRRKREYEELLKSGKTGELKDIPDTEIEAFLENNSTTDKQFKKFKKTTELFPDQILRYARNGSPLWITDDNPLDSITVPNCENCGSRRVYEFQIMPQLLNYLKDDKIDWGVIAVYSCEESCETKSGYLKEFVIKQDIINKSDKTEQK